MSYKNAIEDIKLILDGIGSEIDADKFDGILVKKLEASNTLDKGRTTKQSHIAITGKQMDMFPCITSYGYSDVDYASIDDDIKKYFVAQVPLILHKENLEYLDPSLVVLNEEEEVHVSIVRSRRKDAPDQIQMSMTYLDSPLFKKFRESVHAGSYLVLLKRKREFLYDCFAIKQNDETSGNASLSDYNGTFEKIKSNTVIEIDKVTIPKDSEADISNFSHNRIFFGAPGTGKSYQMNQEKDKLLFQGGGYERVTFHPDYSYANFVGTYKPVPDKDKSENEVITYKYVPGPFMRVLSKALKSDATENPQPYLLVIEEINRANVAAVFGDVFQLLDRDDNGLSEYPIATSEDMRAYLAEELGCAEEDVADIKLPSNMFIWATMNSADQGVFLMDTAFKRRWDFTYIGIDKNDSQVSDKWVVVGSHEQDEIEWNSLRVAINDFLALKGINEDKQLGPYFLAKRIVIPKDGSSKIDSKTFCDAFKSKVLMYLFEDAGKTCRKDLFAGVGNPPDRRESATILASNATRYSKICEAFDVQGIGIFNNDIISATKKKRLKMNGKELDENGILKSLSENDKTENEV